MDKLKKLVGFKGLRPRHEGSPNSLFVQEEAKTAVALRYMGQAPYPCPQVQKGRLSPFLGPGEVL